MDEGHILAGFITQLILLLLVGRLLGEAMSRIGQPAIFGQLLAGVVLGPSVFGLVLPELQHMAFPDTPELKQMIDGVAQVGILLLLLLTGMETNLQLVKRKFRVVVTTSLTGIAVPFACGFSLGYLLPDYLVPDAGRQLVTAMFLGTALSISSVKIVAMVLMEVGFIKRDLGQLILATAILDDTLAWILVAIISGMASTGTIDPFQIGFSIVAVIIFLTASLTIGSRLVAHLIRWSNDTFTIDFPVITAILVVTLSLALVTDLIGVHSALGAFVAGILIGQSPILTGHIEKELRGLIMAFFGPVFFGVAGLGMDLTTLAEPSMLLLAVAFIAVATIGKSLGAMIGGKLAGLNARESFALATGLNARGSTEVIIATIGVTMGVLNNELYTLIVLMAVITTMIMPPTLRWALSKVEMREDEKTRLDEEEASENDQLTKIERVLVIVDHSTNGILAAHLAGAFAAGHDLLTTIAWLGPVKTDKDASFVATITETANSAARTSRDNLVAALQDEEQADTTTKPVVDADNLIQVKVIDEVRAIETEIGNGYSIIIAGLGKPFDREGKHFSDGASSVLVKSGLPVAIVIANNRKRTGLAIPASILVPTSGTQSGSLAAEVAGVLSRSGSGQMTALHVIDPDEERKLLRGRWSDKSSSVLAQIEAHAKRTGIDAQTVAVSNAYPKTIIQRRANSGKFDLLALGAELRGEDRKFIGTRTRKLIEGVRIPILLFVR